MYLDRDGKFVRTDIWREGEYLDFWSVPHFLSGIALALALHLLGFGFFPAIIFGFLLLVAYEAFEYLARIEETRWNRILDVVVGMASFVPTLYIAPSYGAFELALAFTTVAAIDSLLSYFGWKASQKADVLEGALRGEIELRRQNLKARHARIRDRLRAKRLAWRTKRALRKGAPPSDAHVGEQ